MHNSHKYVQKENKEVFNSNLYEINMMIVVTLLSINMYIKIMKIDLGVFEKEEFKNILQKSKLI